MATLRSFLLIVCAARLSTGTAHAQSATTFTYHTLAQQQTQIDALRQEVQALRDLVRGTTSTARR